MHAKIFFNAYILRAHLMLNQMRWQENWIFRDVHMGGGIITYFCHPHAGRDPSKYMVTIPQK